MSDAATGDAGARLNELEALSTEELHHRAVRRAERHLDVRFLWRLLSETPAAKAVSGDVGEADYDVQHVSGMLTDALSEEGEGIREALRPIYLDYLLAHRDG